MYELLNQHSKLVSLEKHMVAKQFSTPEQS